MTCLPSHLLAGISIHPPRFRSAPGSLFPRFQRHLTIKTIVLMVVVGVVVPATYPKGGVYTDIAERPVYTTVLFGISAAYWGMPFLLAILVTTPRVCAVFCGAVSTLSAITFICVSFLLSIAFEPATAPFHCLDDFAFAVGATLTPAMAAWSMCDQSFTPDIRYLWVFVAAEVPMYALLAWLATHTCKAKHIES